jgi:shikimate kinase
MSTDVSISHRPFVLELLGPAGAGKSSLLRTLARRDPDICTEICFREIKNIPIVMLNALALAPALVGAYRDHRKPEWCDIKQIARMKAYYPLLGREGSRSYRAVILDEGPIFLLTWLHAFGQDRLKSQVIEKLSQNALDRWAKKMDAIIWLDAPNAVLARRIRERRKPHRVKGETEKEIHKFLSHYRVSYELIISKLTADRGPKVIRFNTEQSSLDQIADEVMVKMSQGF